VAQGLRQRDIEYVDSPVSGGVTGAVKGTLAVMVSCRREIFDGLEAVLQNFGKTFFVGPEAGQAQTVKLANNVMSAAAVAITSEAVVMGVKAGIDPKIMLDVINAGSGRNTASADKFPRCVLPRTFDVGFAAALAHKDVRLCVDEAEHMGVPMVVGASVREMLAITLAQCGPQADFVDVVKVCESWAGVEVRG
jgi:3-hydroxyisobutyrate dehydrogenase